MDKLGTAKETGQKKEVTCEPVNGDRIPNLGEREFGGRTSEEREKKIVAQVMDITHDVMLMNRGTENENKVVLDEKEPYVKDAGIGEMDELHKEEDPQTWRPWIRTEQRQEDNQEKRIGLEEEEDFRRRGESP